MRISQICEVCESEKTAIMRRDNGWGLQNPIIEVPVAAVDVHKRQGYSVTSVFCHYCGLMYHKSSIGE